MFAIEFGIHTGQQIEWFPVLETRKVNAKPQTFENQQKAEEAIEEMRQNQPQIQYRVVVAPVDPKR
jgi:hypothetical protein